MRVEGPLYNEPSPALKQSTILSSRAGTSVRLESLPRAQSRGTCFSLLLPYLVFPAGPRPATPSLHTYYYFTRSATPQLLTSWQFSRRPPPYFGWPPSPAHFSSSRSVAA